MSRRAPEGIRKVVAGGLAELVPDPDRAGSWTLFVDGTPQSHVDLDDPTYLDFEYVRWFGHVVDLLAPAGLPLNVLHLGGGAWTFPRYVAATRPASRQRVVEIDQPLTDLVREHLPAAAGIRVRTGEAREVLTSLREDTVDLLVLDVFEGARTPAHLTSREFLAEAARVLRPGGTYLANVADGDRLGYARAQMATLADTFRRVAVIAPAPLLRGRRFGNLALVGGDIELSTIDLARRAAGDPFPARVMSDAEVRRFCAGSRVVHDADAQDSPAPPDGLMGAVPDE